MSRVGKNPVEIPEGVQCQLVSDILTAKGKLGELKLDIPSDVEVTIAEGAVTVKPRNESQQARMLWGTIRSLISNLVQGVHEGFTRRLELNGVGYRAAVQGKELVLNLGYSHDIRYPIPEEIKVTCEKPTSIAIFGADRQRVGQMASEIRAFRKPEPYKGKGVKYEEETIFRKEGKKK